MKPHMNFLAVVLLLVTGESWGQVLKPTNAFVSVSGDIAAKEDISAIATISERFIAIGADEDIEGENRIQLLHTEDDGYAVHNDILLLKDKEMDIEGIAADGNTIYVVGSHSSKRPKIKKSKKYEENRRKFYADKIKDERNRDWLYQVVIDKEGKEIAKERISLPTLF